MISSVLLICTAFDETSGFRHPSPRRARIHRSLKSTTTPPPLETVPEPPESSSGSSSPSLPDFDSLRLSSRLSSPCPVSFPSQGSPPTASPSLPLLPPIEIYDTTLRDGAQMEGVSLSVSDKLRVASALAEFGVDRIEGGFAGSNGKDERFFEEVYKEGGEGEWGHLRDKLVCFGSTRYKNVPVEEDKGLKALVDCKCPNVCIVAKAHSWQVREILQCSVEENLLMISDSIRYLREKGKRNIYVDLEHFFDGYKFDPPASSSVLDACVSAGATHVVLCDTNGGTQPGEMRRICGEVTARVAGCVPVGIHAHNDCGMAVANSVIAVEEGCRSVQGCVNGLGERTGNADLTQIIPNLVFHGDDLGGCIQAADSLPRLTWLSHFIDKVVGIESSSSRPFVGISAFAHKG